MKSRILKSVTSMFLVLNLLICCVACSSNETAEKNNPNIDSSKPDATLSHSEESYDESLLVEPVTQNEIQIKNLTVKSENEISVSANTQYFTNALKYSDINGQSDTIYRAYKGNINNFPKALSPVSSNLFVSKSLPDFYSVSLDNADSKYVYLSSTKIPSDINDDYVAFDIFVKSDKEQKVYWGNDETVSFGNNKDFLTYTRVAVINCGIVAEGASYDNILRTVPENATTNSVVMYEPSTNHTDSSGYSGKTVVPDIYISSEFSNLKVPVQKGNNILQYAQHTSASLATRVTDQNMNTNAFFNAQTGINRIRVYVWLESNDVDCENAIALNMLDINLNFTTK